MRSVTCAYRKGSGITQSQRSHIGAPLGRQNPRRHPDAAAKTHAAGLTIGRRDTAKLQDNADIFRRVVEKIGRTRAKFVALPSIENSLRSCAKEFIGTPYCGQIEDRRYACSLS
jgi:hypothetical protein